MTASLGPEDDERVQRIFDETVGADRDRLARLIEFNAYGISHDQLIADRIRVCEPPERVSELLADLVVHQIAIEFRYKNHLPLYFHRNNLEREPVTRDVFELIPE